MLVRPGFNETAPEGSHGARSDWGLSGRYERTSPSIATGIVKFFRAQDHVRGDECWIGELSPPHLPLNSWGTADLSAWGPEVAHRLRSAFFHEAFHLGRTPSRHLLQLRDRFFANGTAYTVWDGPGRVRPLGQWVSERELVRPDELRSIASQLLETLRAVHRSGALLLGLDFETVWITDEGTLIVCSFGQTTQWLCDVLGAEGAKYAPSCVAPEQRVPGSVRSAATDVFGLCCLLYRLGIGVAPPEPKRGVSVPVPKVAFDSAAHFWGAVQLGLSLLPEERPNSAEKCGELLAQTGVAEPVPEDLESFEERALRLMTFRFARRECPSCGGVLERASPLPRLTCPVCRESKIRLRRFDPASCPVCHEGPVREFQNDSPIKVCPLCRSGLLSFRRGRWSLRVDEARCETCRANFDLFGGWLSPHPDASSEPARPDSEWREFSGRSLRVRVCLACQSQFDSESDGRWTLIASPKRMPVASQYEEEWLRVASGLSPESGNAVCESCRSDYFLHGGMLTLIEARRDYFGFARHYTGQAVPIEQLPWIGVGKVSSGPGFVCSDCSSEFDDAPAGLRLVQTTNPTLRERTGKVLDLESWHRTAQRLPMRTEEREFESGFDRAMVEAYEQGRLPFGKGRRKRFLWRSPCVRLELRDEELRARSRCRFAVTPDYLEIGTVRRTRIRREEIAGVRLYDDSSLVIERIEGSAVYLQVPTVVLAAKLRSGPREARIGVANLANRLRTWLDEKPSDEPIPRVLRPSKPEAISQ